jgi:hypothetical protein
MAAFEFDSLTDGKRFRMTVISANSFQALSRLMELRGDLWLRIMLVAVAIFTWGVVVPYSILAGYR